MASTHFRGPRQLWAALVWSLHGLRAAFRGEASFRLEVYMAVVAIPLGLWLGHGGAEKSLLGGSPLLVLSAELLNSAMETIVDKISPEFSEMAGRAKDMGSAAILMLLMLVALCWAVILLPRWF